MKFYDNDAGQPFTRWRDFMAAAADVARQGAQARYGTHSPLAGLLAVAVLLDATIVRSVLVPASMEMLGDLNWYLPSWLGWLPRISVEGPQA